jgi:hypothetical protein
MVIENLRMENIMPWSTVFHGARFSRDHSFSNGLASFCAAADAKCKHRVEITGGRKRKDGPNFE